MLLVEIRLLREDGTVLVKAKAVATEPLWWDIAANPIIDGSLRFLGWKWKPDVEIDD